MTVIAAHQSEGDGQVGELSLLTLGYFTSYEIVSGLEDFDMSSTQVEVRGTPYPFYPIVSPS